MAKSTEVTAMLNANAKKLTKRERKLWNKIRPQSGVVMAYGIPGISKSATFTAIAEKLDMQYIDIRTSTKDETDMGSYPTVTGFDITANGITETINVVDGTVPKWAIRANQKPTLIHFEELNRCSELVRSAALGILLEGNIGEDFKFNENVYMVASGNPSTKHDMDVEEFGSALRNRLIPLQFSLSFEEWEEAFALENVHPLVLKFLRGKKEIFGNTVAQLDRYMDEDNMTQYPSPRSWTFLSDYLKGYEEDELREVTSDLEDMGTYVGDKAALVFYNWCESTFKVNVKDVLGGKADKDTLDSMGSTNAQRIIKEFEDGYKLENLNKKEFKNWVKFMDNLPKEFIVGHFSELLGALDGTNNKAAKVFKEFLEEFPESDDILTAALDAQ
jgi:hypothetical protein